MSSLKAGPSSESAHSEAARQIFYEQDVESTHGALEEQKFEYDDGPKGITPLPKAQLATLCAIRLVDPIAFTQIFPYVNEMMERLHLTNDPSKIGFYSGLVESSFAVSQLFCIYNWAQISGEPTLDADRESGRLLTNVPRQNRTPPGGLNWHTGYRSVHHNPWYGSQPSGDHTRAMRWYVHIASWASACTDTSQPVSSPATSPSSIPYSVSSPTPPTKR